MEAATIDALMPLIVLFSVAMLRKEYQENLASGMNVTAARSAEYLSTIQVTLFAAFYGLAIARIQKRDIAEHMRYMICIALVLLPAGLARTLGYWFGVRQASSQTVCLALIDLCLISLIAYDRRRHYAARPYVVALAAYVIIEIMAPFLRSLLRGPSTRYDEARADSLGLRAAWITKNTRSLPCSRGSNGSTRGCSAL